MATSKHVHIVQLGLQDLLGTRMFCGRSKKYAEMYDRKAKWFAKRLEEGMRYKLYQHEPGKTVGFIETIPGENAWRAVDAKGYLFVHCFWVLGKSKGKGYGTALLKDTIADARRSGYSGVAVVTSFEHWLPNKRIFIKHGFEQVDQLPPAFELFVKRFDTNARLPRFNRNTAALEKLPDGLVIYRSEQCPYIDVSEMSLREAAEKLSLDITVIEVRTSKQAQKSPCPYGVTGVFLDRELVSYHPIGGKHLIDFIKAKRQE